MTKVKRFKFNCDTIEDASWSVHEYLTYLLEIGLAYHLDDEPDTIEWRTVNISEEDINTLQANHTDMWSCMNPWAFFDMPENTELWYKWLNR